MVGTALSWVGFGLGGAAKGLGKLVVWLITSPVGRLVLACALIWGALQYGQHQGRAEADAEWTVKWNKHLAADKLAHDNAVADYKARTDRLMGFYNNMLAILQAQLDAAKNRPPIVKTVIKEVTKYVTPAADARAPVPVGFVWVHNLAATESAADQAAAMAAGPPGDVDAPSGVALSTVAETVASNYDECRTRGELLTLWQHWYVGAKQQYEAFNRPLTQAEQQEFVAKAFDDIDKALERYSHDRAREDKRKPPIYSPQ